MLRRVIVLAILIAWSNKVFCQPIELRFTSVGKEKGLSNSNVSCITQDSLGYIWIGTWDGLNKYDGFEIVVYKLNFQDSTSLPHNAIRCLYTDSQGRVWVGTDNGLCYYQPYWDSFKRVRLPEVTPGQEIAKVDFIGESPSHELIYSMSNKLYLVDIEDNRSTPFLEVQEGEITSFLFDKNENLWVSAFKGGGLYQYDISGKLITHYLKEENNSNSLSSSSLMYLALRDDHNLWIATEDEGLNCYDITSHQFTRYPFEVYDDKFTRFVYVDQENHLWVGGYTGIKLYDDKDKVFYGYYTDPKNPNSIKPNGYKLFQDNQGNYWVLHLPGGVSMSVQQKGFKIFSDNQYETWHSMNKTISAVQEDMYGNLWLANPFNGIDIFYWTRNTTLRFTYDSQDKYSLGAGAVFAFEVAGEGMWVGTNRGGLQYISNKLDRFTTYMHDPNDSGSIAGNDIRGIHLDSKGKVWLAIHGRGVDMFDPEEGVFYHFNNANNNLSNDWTLEVIEDYLGNIWVATVYGISRLPQGKQKFVNYYTDQENTGALSKNEITTVFEDSLHRVWAGTSQGLNRYIRDRDVFESVRGELEDEYICSILDDNNNTLWVATLNGLFHYDPATQEISRFDESDGLPTNEFYPRSSFKNLFNALFFGTIDGVILFNPNKLNYNKVKPSVVITNFKLFNREIEKFGPDQPLDRHVSFADQIRLDYDQNMISFEFIAISMINPEKNQYAYKLDGFDEEWHYIGSRKEATYTNLDPGKYTFRVIASNNDGIWNKKGASIRVIVKPPWWKTLGFRVLASLSILFSFAAFVYFRTNQLRKQKLVLERKVKQSTIELQEKNKQLVEKSNHLNEINTLLEERQQEILEKSTKLQELNASKDRLFSIIAHDLTSPFNTILGFSEMLQTNYDNFDEKERKEMAETINDSAKRVYSLLDNLLNWARTQTNRIKYDPEKLDLESIITEALDIYRFRLERKKIQVEIENKTERKAYADLDMIRSILRNLISNATKYTLKNGKITITIEQDHNEIRISIGDTGVGINKEVYNNLFNLDRSSSQEGTDGEKGSGIGLILTNEFIGLNGGTLSIRSKEGIGSTFSFTLPMSE